MIGRREFLSFLCGLPFVKTLFPKREEARRCGTVPLSRLLDRPVTFIRANGPFKVDDSWWRDDFFTPFERVTYGGEEACRYRWGCSLHAAGCRLGVHLLNLRTREIVELTGFKSEVHGFSWITKSLSGGTVGKGRPKKAPYSWFVCRGRGALPAADVLAGDEFLFLGYAGQEWDS